MLTTIKNVKEIVRSLKVSLISTLPGIILGIFFAVLGLVVHSFIFSLFWNYAIPTMFGFQALTTFNTLILLLVIASIRANHISNVSFLHIKIKKALSNKLMENRKWDIQFERTIDVFSLIASILLVAVSIIFYINLLVHSWNVILPNLFGLELYHINFIQAFAFAAVANYIFSKDYKAPTEIESSVDKKVTESSSAEEDDTDILH